MELIKKELYNKAPENFKQTEVKVIPKDWKVNALGDVAFITKLAGFEYSLHFNSYKDEGDIVVVRGTNITHNKMDLSDVKTIPSSTSKKLQRSKLFKNDLVFAYVGTIGPIFLIEENNRYHLGPNTAKISVGKEINSKYLYYYFTSYFIENEIFKATSIGAQPSLSMSKIRSFKIITPTLTEQKAIATALSDVDELIASLDKLIVKKKAIKQGAMQELLGFDSAQSTTPRRRLPGFDGEWVEKRLSEIARINMGQSPLSANYNKIGAGLPLVQGNADISKRKTIIRNYTTQITKVASKGDIIMSVRAPVGEIAVAKFKCCIGRGVCSLNYPNDFLYHYLIFLEPTWEKLSTGSTFDSINSNQLKSLKIKIPSAQDEQIAIAKILSDMDLEIEQLQAKKAKYQQIKQGMMQELLTGKIRLV